MQDCAKCSVRQEVRKNSVSQLQGFNLRHGSLLHQEHPATMTTSHRPGLAHRHYNSADREVNSSKTKSTYLLDYCKDGVGARLAEEREDSTGKFAHRM